MRKTETYGRGLYAVVLAFVSLLSVAGNAVYAYAAPEVTSISLPPGWAAAAHMIPPITLLLVTEVLATASTRFSGRGRTWALAGVVAIAAAAFTLSFDALYEVAQMAKVRPELAWLVPVMLDAAIVVCTTLVLMASRAIQRDRAATLDEQVAAPVVDRLVEQPTELVSEQLDHPGRAVVDHLSEHSDTGVAEQVSEQLDHADELVSELDEPVSDRSSTGGDLGIHLDEHPAEQGGRAVSEWPVERVGHPVDQLSEQVDEQGVRAVSERVDEQTVDQVDEHLDELPTEQLSEQWQDLAERVRSASSVTADPTELAQVLELDARGLSRREISEAVGRPRSTVSGWIKAAQDLEEVMLVR